MINTKWSLLNFPEFIDARGSLLPIELNSHFPFNVKRTYFVRAINNSVVRGGHAHYLEQEVFIAISGSIKARIHDGQVEKEILLDTPTKALYVNTNCWHEFTEFTDEAILFALSSTPYLPGEDNYCTDKTVFLTQNQTQKNI